MAGHNNLEQWRLHQRFKRTHNLVTMFIGMVILVIIMFWVGVGILMYKTADEVTDNGLKSVVERIWYGPEDDDETDEASQPD